MHGGAWPIKQLPASTPSPWLPSPKAPDPQRRLQEGIAAQDERAPEKQAAGDGIVPDEDRQDGGKNGFDRWLGHWGASVSDVSTVPEPASWALALAATMRS